MGKKFKEELKKSWKNTYVKLYVYIFFALIVWNFVAKSFVGETCFFVGESVLLFIFIILYAKYNVFDGWNNKKFLEKGYDFYILIILFSFLVFLLFEIFKEFGFKSNFLLWSSFIGVMISVLSVYFFMLFESRKGKKVRMLIMYLLFSFLFIVVFSGIYSLLGGTNGLVFSNVSFGEKVTGWDYFYFSFGNYYLSSFGDIIPLGNSRIVYYVQVVFSVTFHTFFVTNWFNSNPKT